MAAHNSSQPEGSALASIPVIDFSSLHSADPHARKALASAVRDAATSIGFFYIKSHDIPQSVIFDAMAAGKRFFALSQPYKDELDIRKSSNFKGYTALLSENTNPENYGDLHEGFDLGWEEPEGSASHADHKPTAMSGLNVWPDEQTLPGFKKSVLDYYYAAVRLGKAIFPLLALALDLPESWFDDKITKPAAIMRLLHYPPQPRSEDDTNRMIGIGAHTDYECFTILWQDDIGGLQVRNTDGNWVDAVPIPGTFVLNFGDQLARWSNDVIKSTPHRVINRTGAERYSMPLFFGTDYNVLLEPIPSCVSPTNPAKYDAVTAGDYVKSRLEETYRRHEPRA